MPQRPLTRRYAHHHEDQPGVLPTPGPYPAAIPPCRIIVIFVVIVAGLAWLLAEGYSLGAAFGILAGASALTSTVTARLTILPPAAR